MGRRQVVRLVGGGWVVGLAAAAAAEGQEDHQALRSERQERRLPRRDEYHHFSTVITPWEGPQRAARTTEAWPRFDNTTFRYLFFLLASRCVAQAGVAKQARFTGGGGGAGELNSIPRR